MRKYLILSLITLVTMAPDALAIKYSMESTERCFVEWDGNPDEFFYCGLQESGCHGHNDKGKKSFWFTDGETHTIGGDGKGYNGTWVCCANNEYKWRRYTDPYESLTYNGKSYAELTTDEEKAQALSRTHTLPDGNKCKYQLELDNCGNDISPLCTEPDECVNGLILRNKVCVAPCGVDQGYETAESNVCIECPTTIKGGVNKVKTIKDANDKDIANPNYGVCVKCHETAELFIYTTGECKKKTEITTQYTNAAFALCWRCETNVDFKNCVEKLSGQQFDSSKLAEAPPSCR